MRIVILSRQPALFELSRHREQPLPDGGEIPQGADCLAPAGVAPGASEYSIAGNAGTTACRRPAPICCIGPLAAVTHPANRSTTALRGAASATESRDQALLTHSPRSAGKPPRSGFK